MPSETNGFAEAQFVLWHTGWEKSRTIFWPAGRISQPPLSKEKIIHLSIDLPLDHLNMQQILGERNVTA